MQHEQHDPTRLPSDLPAPVDDGAADHLLGLRVPPIALPATDSREIRLDSAPTDAERWVVYAYPRTGVPGEEPLTPDWDAIPGARGCTPESCGFRDHAADLRAAGAAVAGLSTQDTAFQQELATRLHLPFPVLSDHDLALTRALRLPTFEAAGQTLLRRLTMVIHQGVVEYVFYPVFPPDGHAAEVLAWLSDRRGAA
ncbi:MAG TPA: peroxiredoxin [Nocardioidaceae bacterium]|nr:peroxiredoxin [Nocardioidaceae bacterium]